MAFDWTLQGSRPSTSTRVCHSLDIQSGNDGLDLDQDTGQGRESKHDRRHPITKVMELIVNLKLSLSLSSLSVSCLPSISSYSRPLGVRHVG